jgi:hypothetical protein
MVFTYSAVALQPVCVNKTCIIAELTVPWNNMTFWNQLKMPSFLQMVSAYGYKLTVCNLGICCCFNLSECVVQNLKIHCDCDSSDTLFIILFHVNRSFWKLLGKGAEMWTWNARISIWHYFAIMLKPPANGPLSNKIFQERLDTPVFVKIGKVLQKKPRSSYWSAAWASYT